MKIEDHEEGYVRGEGQEVLAVGKGSIMEVGGNESPL
jgi:hypothetical protein